MLPPPPPMKCPYQQDNSYCTLSKKYVPSVNESLQQYYMMILRKKVFEMVLGNSAVVHDD